MLFVGWTGVNERTFVAVKPDGVQRKQVGAIVRRFEKKGFKLVGLKLMQVLRLLFNLDEQLNLSRTMSYFLYFNQNVSLGSSGLGGAPQGTLLGPEEQAFLHRTRPLHDLRACRRNGKTREICLHFSNWEFMSSVMSFPFIAVLLSGVGRFGRD